MILCRILSWVFCYGTPQGYELIKTCDLDPEKQYLFLMHPHGILAEGFGYSMCTVRAQREFSRLFPGIFWKVGLFGYLLVVYLFIQLIVAHNYKLKFVMITCTLLDLITIVKLNFIDTSVYTCLCVCMSCRRPDPGLWDKPDQIFPRHARSFLLRYCTAETNSHVL